MYFRHRTLLAVKLKESTRSVLPITLIVFALCFTILPVPGSALMAFVMGSVMLIFGMSLFTLGTDLAMTPIGEGVGSHVTRTRKIPFIIFMCFLVGTIVTMSEPDLKILAEQVPNVPDLTLIITVSVGVGLFLIVALIRILFRIRLSWLLTGLYAVVFLLSIFVPGEFIPVAFDSGGVTTGPMTVPFIMAFGVGIASIRSDSNAESDSFGLVALCSVGPILAVMILGILFRSGDGAYSAPTLPTVDTSVDLAMLFVSYFPTHLRDMAFSLLPIALFFYIFQLFSLKLTATNVVRITNGMLYTYVGLVLFLTGVNAGFMPVGNYLGQMLGRLSYRWIVIPIGMLIGFFIVAAEPAVHVLNKQVFEMTSGSVPRTAMSVSLGIGVAISVGLSMLRMMLDIPIQYILIPGYILAAGLTFFVPPIFTAIAFDSGGVASGPMASTFLLPLTMGFCTSIGGDVVKQAFGVVALVATTPLITIQILGVHYRLKTRKADKLSREKPAEVEEILQ